MDVNEYLTGLLPYKKDGHTTTPLFDEDKGPSLDYKMAQARRHMNVEPDYQTNEYTLEEIMADTNLYDTASKTLKASVAFTILKVYNLTFSTRKFRVFGKIVTVNLIILYKKTQLIQSPMK